MFKYRPASKTYALATRAAQGVIIASFTLALPWIMLACGSDSASKTTTTAAAKCDLTTKPVCASVATAPSYASTVSSIFETYCLQCHDPNGIGAIVGSSHGPAPDANGRVAGAHTPYAHNGNDYNASSSNWDPSAQRDWSNFKNIQQYAQDIKNQVYLCSMPPAAATQMSAADRATLMNWLECGAPDN